MSFNLYTSNRLEILADKLAEVVSKPLSSPMDEETIVVQSLGMQQWISLELARHFGVWANCRYLYPNKFIEELFSAIITDMPSTEYFEREIMAWRIMKVLPTCLERKEFASLRHYLGNGSGFLKTLQIARHIGNLFDQYVVFRPRMIYDWERGRDRSWQSELWRLINYGIRPGHKAALSRTVFEELKNPSSTVLEKLPTRIAVFGISSLPPLHMNIFQACAAHREVNLFLTNPSREYWAQIRSSQEIARERRRQELSAEQVEELHLEIGNSLLASMGRLGRDFLEIITESNPNEHEYFEDSGKGSLLHVVQSDILSMVDRGAGGEMNPPAIRMSRESMQADDSIRVNSCHSPMREAEVLYDFLLDLFNNDSTLKPRDVLVMTPDIDTYAPFLRAVFDAPHSQQHRIPFHIADRGVIQENILVKTFLNILNLATGRLGAGEVLDILECEEVRRKFNLEVSAVDRIHEWIKDTRICWGIDADYRADMELPAYKENTWQAGIERLLLGYAMPGGNRRLFCDILPYDNIEGSEAQVLGNFITFLETLITMMRSLDCLLTLSQWKEVLLQLLERMFLADEATAQDEQRLRRIIGRLAAIEQQSGFAEKIERRVVQAWLEYAVQNESWSSTFLTGMVTFCALLPMRSIPFRVICLIGMNDTAFPRKVSTASFDLIALHPQRGDRSQRDDDRYLFLEALISARDRLYISYVGQGIQDNSEMPPSVVVSELFDYLAQSFVVTDEDLLQLIVTRHRLQAFSPRYFEPDSVLFSYSQENREASTAMLESRSEARPFITGRLPAPEPEQYLVQIQDLAAFFVNPAKFLLTRRLGLYLEDAPEALSEREPFAIDRLDRYSLEQQLCDLYLNKQDNSELYQLVRAAGILPHGNVGRLVIQEIIPEVKKFAEKLQAYVSGPKCQPYEINTACGAFHITGKIKNVWNNTLVHYRCARTRAIDLLRVWIQHLALHVAGMAQQAGHSICIGKDAVYVLNPPGEQAAEILSGMLNIYHDGLTRLVPFFPESSLAYAEALTKEKTVNEALKAAQMKWDASEWNPVGESSNRYFEYCFRQAYPFEAEFQKLSCDVYNPLLDYREKERL